MADDVTTTIDAGMSELSGAEPAGADQGPIDADSIKGGSGSDRDPVPDEDPRSVESTVQRAWDEQQAQAGEAGEMDAIFGPLAERMKASGLSRPAAVRAAMATAEAVARDPGSAMAQIAGHLVAQGARPDQVLAHIGRALGVDPQTAQPTTPQERAAYEATSSISAFEHARGENGQAAYPHFARVRQQMGNLMMAAVQAGEKMDLTAAYEKAVWMDDTIRPELIRQQQAAAAPGRSAEMRASVAKARGAATPRTANVAVAEPSPYAGLSLDELIGRGFSQFGLPN